jgi:predicted nuclease of predicted toxin-antitoxin system
MRVLLDECVPRALKYYLVANGHDCDTVQENGWSGRQNGELLGLAEVAYEVLVTVDTNIRYQQNLKVHKIAIVVFQSASNRLELLRQLFPACLSALGEIKSGDIVLIGEGT